MTEEMLDFSKPLVLHKVRGNLATAVQASLAKLKDVARRHNVSLEYRSDTDMAWIDFDSLRFEQVIVNLVRNALEASPQGDAVTITLFSFTSGSLVVDVADNGCGIACYTAKSL